MLCDEKPRHGKRCVVIRRTEDTGVAGYASFASKVSPGTYSMTRKSTPSSVLKS